MGSGDVEMDELALTLEQADWKFYKPFPSQTQPTAQLFALT
jgi:hypothetical protein